MEIVGGQKKHFYKMAWITHENYIYLHVNFHTIRPYLNNIMDRSTYIQFYVYVYVKILQL